VRFICRAAFAFGVAFSIVGGPSSAAPTAPNATEAIAQATPAPLATLAGQVVDASTNASLGGVAISARGPGGSLYTTTSAGDGSFSLSLPEGVYDIDATKGGFQAGQVTGFAVTAGVTSTLRVALTEANSGSLRTIGRVSVTRRTSLNTSSSATASLDSSVIQQRQNANLSDVVPELPGVTLLRTTGATANSFFVVRGADVETKVNIDGHPLSVGTFGNYNANYAIGSIFDQVEVLKGAGLNGPTAGESAFGTINLRTRDFSPTNYADITLGVDGYKGSFYNAFANVNLLKDNRLSLLVGRAYSGFRGPWDEYVANRIGNNTGIPSATYQIPTFPGLIQWQGDLSNRYGLAGELAKARYRFSNSTSVTLEYLGLQGQYIPQGGSYASFEGYAQVAPCYNGGTPGTSAASCGVTSVYNPPYASNLIGQQVPAYFWFPNSYIQNNEPEFSAEFRTSLKNDTILVRPYTALVNRFISGDRENRYPGNNGGWYEVTNAANCQATFASPTTANGGAKGPCFANKFAGPTGPAYIGASNPASVVYSTTTSAPTCSVTAPCWTTPTGQQNDGKIGFGTPFSQPEVDRLHGVTFQYLHPVHDNLYSLSYDYNSDDTNSTTNDTTATLAGCTPTLGGPPNTLAAGTLGAQPTCALTRLARTAIAIPPTIIRKNDFAATGLLQLSNALQASLGLYFTNYRSAAQIEDPAVLAQYAAGPGSGYAPVALVSRTNTVNHLDPHVGFTYRVDQNLVLRANGGSSVTLPYASLISGLGSVDLPNGANNQAYTLSLANSSLRPETTVAYDLGFDYRLPDSSIFSVDAFDNTVHNIFASATVATAPIPGITAPGGYFQSTTINGPIGRYYGLELALNKSLPIGFGYTLEGSFERAYLDQLSPTLYTSALSLINGKQLDGSVNGQASIPYAKGYGEIRYAGVRNSLVSFGADYEGANNSTYGPAYVVFNSTVRFEVAPKVAFQIAADNLFGFSTGTALGRALFNQGSATLQLGPGPNGTLVNARPRTKSLQEVNPKTFRFSLSHRF
jgi:outer membrane receptor protein involved in Fe transport